MRVDAVAPTMALAIVLGMLFCAGAAPGVETPTKRSDLSALSDKELKAFRQSVHRLSEDSIELRSHPRENKRPGAEKTDRTGGKRQNQAFPR